MKQNVYNGITMQPPNKLDQAAVLYQTTLVRVLSVGKWQSNMFFLLLIFTHTSIQCINLHITVNQATCKHCCKNKEK